MSLQSSTFPRWDVHTHTPEPRPHPQSLPLPHSPETALPHLRAQRRHAPGHSLPQGGQPCPGCPDWAPAPWPVPRSSSSAAGLVVRLPPDLGRPGLPAPASIPCMAWPQPTGLRAAAPRWSRQCCQFWGVLPGLGEGARFGVFLCLAVLAGLGGLLAGFRCAPGLGGVCGFGGCRQVLGSVPGSGGCCQFWGKLQGLGVLLCHVHAARFGECCQVWGASGFRVCSWIWAMLPGLRVSLGLAGAAGFEAVESSIQLQWKQTLSLQQRQQCVS